MSVWVRPARDGDEPWQEVPKVVGFRVDVEGEGEGITCRRDPSRDYAERERSARERLFYRVRPTHMAPESIEGRSELKVSDVL